MKNKSRANFSFRIGTYKTKKWLLIVDKNSGGMSVTNDIENVVDDISAHVGIDPLEYRIIYKDSEGRWDGWDHKTQTFYLYPQASSNKIENDLKLGI